MFWSYILILISSLGTNAINDTKPAIHPETKIFVFSVISHFWWSIYFLEKLLLAKIKALIGMFPSAGDQTPLKNARKPPSFMIYYTHYLIVLVYDIYRRNFIKSRGYPAHVEVIPAIVPASKSIMIALLERWTLFLGTSPSIFNGSMF